MKKIFTLCLLVFTATFAKAQVVLNEVYPNPGNAFQEYFELYNTSTNPVPESLDNYTIVSYYEEPSGKSGFYVLDLPNQTVTAKGFYVGSSLSIFAIQGQSGLNANVNWNSLPSGGALTKWEKNGASYTSVAVPANLNDLFLQISGGGGSSAAYSIWVYQNGVLVNGIMGGTNANIIAISIKSMPDLFVDMIGSSPDFTIKFSVMTDNSVEYITGTAGTNNGYYRQYDGKCGFWLQSSTAVDYTPGQSNGSASNTLGELTISAVITSYNSYNSLLTYNITASPVDALPVVVDVYQDLGIIGELDASDLLLDARIVYTISEGEQYVIVPGLAEPVIIVIKSPAGCYDRVIAFSNSLSTLPVHLISFQGNMDKNNKVILNWTVADNETVNSFEIERSINGKDFTTAGVVFASEKNGTENYTFFETVNYGKVIYRLKMIDKNHDIDYSRILVFSSKAISSNDIKLIGNPVNDKLTFSYFSNTAQQVSIKVYDMAGKTLVSQKINSLEGANMLSLPLNTTFKPGMYVVEVSNGTDRRVAKFVKQ